MTSKNKKVLIVVYYWPPSGGSGVQRWLKFVKYLPQFGWTPVVFTPKMPAFQVRDESLLKDIPAEAEVVHFPIWEPYDIFYRLSRLFGRRLQSKSKDVVVLKPQSFLQRLSIWLRGNFFIPDPKRFWIKSSVRFLHPFILSNDIHTIITSGPPHSLHLIGLRLKRKNPGLNWIADFRDPWSEWGLLDSLLVSKPVRAIHRSLEEKVLKNADKIVTVTSYYVERFKELSGKSVYLLTNGFDDDDFKNIQYIRPEKFVIRHIGLINEKSNAAPFMQAVKELCQTNTSIRSDLSIEFIGDVYADFRNTVEQDPELSLVTRFIPPVSHDEVMETYGRTAALLLILTEYKGSTGYIGGKTFEYMATGLPIVAIGPPDGDAAALLKEASLGNVISRNDPEGMKNTLQKNYEHWRSGKQKISDVANKKYSRREITRDLTMLLK